MAMFPPQALLESFTTGGWGGSFALSDLVETVTARRPAEVLPALARVEEAAQAGLFAVGYVAYEAAPAFDPTLPVKESNRPLLRFTLFRTRREVAPGALPGETCRVTVEEPAPGEERYRKLFGRVVRYIADGDAYQVNLTLRQRFSLAGDPFSLYRRMTALQPAPFAACLAFGDETLLSVSPELFFRREGGRITMAPMKGTASRGKTAGEDEEQRRRLAESVKERAENLMIVDLVRSDLGKVAVTGSVTVPELFRVETYPTLHQMTSVVTADLAPGTLLGDIFAALFPCGSVTGAPKRRSMAIIDELEETPRGAYCGAVGIVSREGAVFSVGIRTAAIDLSGAGLVGVGSGITWDARPEAEWAECRLKARFLEKDPPPFSLVETLLAENGWYPFRERHLERLNASATRLGYLFDRSRADELLAEEGGRGGRRKVRLLLERDGRLAVESEELPEASGTGTRHRAAIAPGAVESRQPLLYHKTTRRPWYAGLRECRPDLLDLIFVNERDEVTEGTIHNIVVRRGERLVTPPVGAGLLPGILRGELLRRGIVTEETVTREELLEIGSCWLVNAVRGWRYARIETE